MKRRRRKPIELAVIPTSTEGWIEESPGVYVAREPAKPSLPPSDSVAERVKQQEEAFEVLPTGKVLIFYGTDDPEAPWSTKDVAPSELIKESEELLEPNEIEASADEVAGGVSEQDDDR